MSVIRRPPARIFFLGRDVVATRHTPADARAVVVTFDFLRSPGEKIFTYFDHFIHVIGYAHVHIHATWNHWYQTEEMAEVVHLANVETVRYDRVVTFGASMGGFGALQFANAVHADAVLAGCPQISINPDNVPWDRRWDEYAEPLSFINDDLVERNLPSHTYVAYDPFEPLDARHADLLLTRGQARPLLCPGSGHAPIDRLNEIGMLKWLLTSLGETGALAEEEFGRTWAAAVASKRAAAVHPTAGRVV